MTDRERLVELLKLPSNCMPHAVCEKCGLNGVCSVQRQADKILADGWMRPPCKVGSDIYTIQNGEIEKHYVMEVSKHNNGNNYIKYVPYGKNGIAELCWVQSRCTDKEIGKTVFLTREEAEKVLKGGVSDA